MKFIEVRNEDLMVRDNMLTVSSFPSALDENKHVVRVLMPAGGEVSIIENSRGEALVELGDFFVDLGYALRKMAFVQEGVIRLCGSDK